MRIKHIQLRNIACFNLQCIELAHLPESGLVTIFAGESGAGKTALLKSMYIGLSWFIARFRDARTAGLILADDEIRKNNLQSRLGIKVFLAPDDINATEESSFQWALYKSKHAHLPNGVSRVELDELMQLIEHYQHQLKADPKSPLPVLAYYPAERQVQDASALAKPPVLSNQLAAYDLNLNQNNLLNRFFEWFREQEDIENEQRANAHRHFFSTASLDPSADLVEIYQHLMQAQQRFMGHYTQQVNTAISMVMPELANLRIQRAPKLTFLVDRHTETIPFSQLSVGSKTLLAMVGDIVRRLCCHNPGSINPIEEASGIIIIDEIELHLSTEQQRHIVERLQRAFPNCQLILSTQSEAIYLGQQHARCYALQNGTSTSISTDYHFDEAHELPEAASDIPAVSTDPSQLLQPIISLLQNNLSNVGDQAAAESGLAMTDEDKTTIQELIDLLQSALITDNKELNSALLNSLNATTEPQPVPTPSHKDGS